MDPRARWTAALIRLVLVAAVVTAPIFLFAEEFDREHVLRVLASNGICALLCLGLLLQLRRGRVELVARIFVLSLLTLVATLAWLNGESVHVNVVNFVLVTLLAAMLLPRAALLWIGAACALVMLGIAWKEPRPFAGEELLEARLESIVQFLPTYAVIVLVLWLHAGARSSDPLPVPDAD